ncbi:MAG: hypothetical protein MJ138_06620 [Kiritimatiellae bacterium]|nr:hypothetical protein [Kiritimatiellia bacterium]
MSAMNVNRTTQGVSFNTGISMAEYNEAPAGQTPGQTQRSILPGSTTVSEALANVFPKDPTAAGQIMGMLAAAGNSTLLRTGNGFHMAAKKAIRNLRGKKDKGGKGEAAGRAAEELENLLDDTELLDQYRAALLES